MQRTNVHTRVWWNRCRQWTLHWNPFFSRWLTLDDEDVRKSEIHIICEGLYLRSWITSTCRLVYSTMYHSNPSCTYSSKVVATWEFGVRNPEKLRNSQNSCEFRKSTECKIKIRKKYGMRPPNSGKSTEFREIVLAWRVTWEYCFFRREKLMYYISASS